MKTPDKGPMLAGLHIQSVRTILNCISVISGGVREMFYLCDRLSVQKTYIHMYIYVYSNKYFCFAKRKKKKNWTMDLMKTFIFLIPIFNSILKVHVVYYKVYLKRYIIISIMD